jgi:hypothetical protein
LIFILTANEALEYCSRERFEGREKFQITNQEDQVEDKWGGKESMNRIDEGSEGRVNLIVRYRGPAPGKPENTASG